MPSKTPSPQPRNEPGKFEQAASWIFGRVTKNQVGNGDASPIHPRKQKARKGGSHAAGKHRKQKK